MRPLCLAAIAGFWIACAVPAESSGSNIQAAITPQSRSGSEASVIEASDAQSQQLVKRYLIPRFVGKRTAQEEESEFDNSVLLNNDGAINDGDFHVDKRGLLLYLLRGFKHEPLELLQDALEDSGEDPIQAHYVTSRESSGGPKSIKILHLGQRTNGAPLFLGRRRAPFFVGKRALSPLFVGKRHPLFVGKRRAPYFVGKREVSPFFVGKKGQPYFVGKKGKDSDTMDDLVFIGDSAVRDKRSVYVGGPIEEDKRAWNSYIPWPEIRRLYYQHQESSPFESKRYIVPDFVGDRNNPQSISAILKALKALEYARQRRRSQQKRPNNAPLFIGRRSAPSDVNSRFPDNYQIEKANDYYNGLYNL